ncbi:hypothetical protein BC941DRAFT_430458 [Chlamydoabsidia padenii]|nr:hypothetical protein BC941DRAFT_430458 [Chlamydoabsidia padenii]
MNYLMERDTAAHDLAEVRKLIDSMNSLVNQQQQQQQQQQKQQQEQLKQQQQQQDQEQKRNEQELLKQQRSTTTDKYPAETTSGTTPRIHNSLPANKLPPLTQDNAAAFLAAMAAAAAAAAANSQQQQQQQSSQATTTHQSTPENKPASPTQQHSTNQQKQSTNPPSNGIVIEVTHLFFNRTLYFQLSLDATIEPLVAWLRLSFNDNSVSGMVLQYKGTDGLWKCLLNRDDSLKRVLNQSLKSNTTILYMRVPREQDLLSSGYTDRRLLALTKPSGA